jgi:hypothetical protein
MLNVIFSVDVELWCDEWEHLDSQFAETFQRYIYGTTAEGDFGLPFTLQQLEQHGLKGVFFVESLFAGRFGLKPLAEIVELIQNHHQEIQLHIHPEWINELPQPLLANTYERRQQFNEFSLEEQSALIAYGKQLLLQAGAAPLQAFRAGNFCLNRDTLAAAAANGLLYDSSCNPCLNNHYADLMLSNASEACRIREYPMTTFNDGFGLLRHAQLTACSFSELERILWQALEAGHSSFMILSHNFEFLNPARNRADPMVIKRFRRLCAFLERHRDHFRTVGFNDLDPTQPNIRQPALHAPLWSTVQRLMQQGWRRQYRYPL